MGTRLYVGNLPFDTTADRLRALLQADGAKVRSVRLVKDPDTGRSRGFAFVELIHADQTQDVIRVLHGANVDGRALTVNEVRGPSGGARARRH